MPHPLLAEMEPVIQVQNVLLKGRHLLQLEVFCFFIYFQYFNILDFAGEPVVAPAPAASEFAASLKSHAEGAGFRVICIMQHRPVNFPHLSQFLFA